MMWRVKKNDLKHYFEEKIRANASVKKKSNKASAYRAIKQKGDKKLRSHLSFINSFQVCEQ